MARLVYSCRFDVAAADGIASVLATYKDWIVGHYRNRRELPDFEFDPEVTDEPEGLPSGHSLGSSVYENGSERAVRIRWSFPDDTDSGLRWANEIRVGQFGDLLQHLRDRGWGKRSSMHISDTTRGKFRSHYEFEYQGKKQLFEPHITIGARDPNSCASIHFIFDQERLKMIVGHVGKHLPNTNT